jgi:hypothetical protein
MEFEEDYLKKIINRIVVGNFSPYKDGNITDTDKYIQQIIDEINKTTSLKASAEAESYGSGFASYTHISISFKDKSDTKIFNEGDGITVEETNGLILYICRLAPYATFAPGNWSSTFDNDRQIDGTYRTIILKEIGVIPEGIWQKEIKAVLNCLNTHQIKVLTQDDLNKPLNFQASIPTMLSDPPFRIFDCFFYWKE